MWYCSGYGDLFTGIGRYRALRPLRRILQDEVLNHLLHRLAPGRFLFLRFLIRASLFLFRFAIE